MLRKVKQSLWLLLVILLGALFVMHRGNLLVAKSTHARISASDFASSTSYRVLDVVDGDTIDVEVYGKRVRIRLLGINTPETVDPRKPVECFGTEASARAKALLMGTSVRVETDRTQGLFDKYGRVLAYIYLPDGTSVNKEMIMEGYAHEYTYRYPYKYQKEFKAAERAAHDGGSGLWSTGVCSR